MERLAEIGSTIVIKGNVTAREDMVISGRLDGSLEVIGHTVTVKAGAQVVADIQARVIVVSGQVTGTLVADERIELKQSAEVEGEITAPSLRVEDGATFQGKAETTKVDAKAALQLAS